MTRFQRINLAIGCGFLALLLAAQLTRAAEPAPVVSSAASITE